MIKSQEVVLVMGYPASGKSQLSQTYVEQGYHHLERDKEGGKVLSLIPKLEHLLLEGKSVVIANLFPTAIQRKPFIEVAQKAEVPIRCLWMETSLEDSQINALQRMWTRYNRLFLTPEELKKNKDPNMFPVMVLFKYRKEFEKPTVEEGFISIEKIPFLRQYPASFQQKAAIFDYDGTLRKTKSGAIYPIDPEDIEILPRRKEKLQALREQGYLLFGVSNQSGVAKKLLTEEQAIACFERTNQLLEQPIEYVFCPHNVPPKCYCRKPQSGLGVYLIEKYQLDPRQCFFVGDLKTDQTFAERLGFLYHQAEEFFQ